MKICKVFAMYLIKSAKLMSLELWTFKMPLVCDTYFQKCCYNKHSNSCKLQYRYVLANLKRVSQDLIEKTLDVAYQKKPQELYKFMPDIAKLCNCL